MRFLVLASFLFFTSGPLDAQSTNKDYDSALAKKLNADAFGMKKYYLVILKKGTAGITDKTRLDSIFGGHMKNIQWLASQNKLVVAGPMSKNDKDYEGIFILNTDNKSEAEKMLETDPAVQMKVLDAEYYLWYGSAALQQTSEIHNKIAKNNF